MIIKGKLISLKPLQQSDLETIYNWRNNSEIREMAIIHPFPISKVLEEKWLNDLLIDTSNKKFIFGIFSNDSKSLIGYVTLSNVNYLNRNCYFGIIIGDPSEQGKGHGKEATSLAVEYAFNNLNLHKVILEVQENNIPAISLYEGLGFKKEGELIEQYFWNGKYYNVHIMSIFHL